MERWREHIPLLAAQYTSASLIEEIESNKKNIA
jgi:hypothetical protein